MTKPVIVRGHSYIFYLFVCRQVIPIYEVYGTVYFDEKIMRMETDNQNGSSRKEPGGYPTGSDHSIRSVN